MSAKEIADRSKPAVVRVTSERGVGTGFVITKDGRIATNLHVIRGATEITVELSDKRKFDVVTVLAVDPQHDLAVFKIAAADLSTVPLGNSDLVSAGDPVIAIGNPLGVFDLTVSDGLISSVRPINDEVTVLQTSAPISQGSSGGPLFNRFGEVIGIATFIATEGQNLNFAIPSNYLRPMLENVGELGLDEFAERYGSSDGSAGTPGDGNRTRRSTNPPVLRKVPKHELSVLDGCTSDQLLAVGRGISQAIEIGAPVYNRGEHEACFVIYRKAAAGFESDQAYCKGVRDAFGEGLLRADSLENFTAKAWAMRDAFDGLLTVIQAKLEKDAKD